MSATFQRRRPYPPGPADVGAAASTAEINPYHARRGTNDFGSTNGTRQPPNAGAGAGTGAGAGSGGTNDSLTLAQQKAAMANVPKEKVRPLLHPVHLLTYLPTYLSTGRGLDADSL